MGAARRGRSRGKLQLRTANLADCAVDGALGASWREPASAGPLREVDHARKAVPRAPASVSRALPRAHACM